MLQPCKEQFLGNQVSLVLQLTEQLVPSFCLLNNTCVIPNGLLVLIIIQSSTSTVLQGILIYYNKEGKQTNILNGSTWFKVNHLHSGDIYYSAVCSFRQARQKLKPHFGGDKTTTAFAQNETNPSSSRWCLRQERAASCRCSCGHLKCPSLPLPPHGQMLATRMPIRVLGPWVARLSMLPLGSCHRSPSAEGEQQEGSGEQPVQLLLPRWQREARTGYF